MKARTFRLIQRGSGIKCDDRGSRGREHTCRRVARYALWQESQHIGNYCIDHANARSFAPRRREGDTVVCG